MKKFKPPI